MGSQGLVWGAFVRAYFCLVFFPRFLLISRVWVTLAFGFSSIQVFKPGLWAPSTILGGNNGLVFRGQPDKPGNDHRVLHRQILHFKGTLPNRT